MITSYEAMPIGTYLDIQAVLSDDTREEATKDLAIVALLTGKTEEEIWDCTLEEYGHLKAGASFLFDQPAEAKLKDKYTIGEFTCTYPRSFRKLTAGQFHDFDVLNKDDNPDKEIALLSVLLVPEGCKYAQGYDALDLRAAIRCNLGVLDAHALTAFFLNSLSKYVRSILSSLERMKMPIAQKKEMKAALRSVANGGGSPGWTQSLTLPTRVGMRYWEQEFANSSI